MFLTFITEFEIEIELRISSLYFVSLARGGHWSWLHRSRAPPNLFLHKCAKQIIGIFCTNDNKLLSEFFAQILTESEIEIE